MLFVLNVSTVLNYKCIFSVLTLNVSSFAEISCSKRKSKELLNL